ncbi:MAG: anti-sigma factor [Candidatus Acidiferrales bacterium]
MSGHPTRAEDFELFALGALEGEEKLAIESHLAGCSDCARKLAEARGRISLLAFAAPAAEPSPQVKERLLRRLHETSEDRSPSHPPAQPERAGGIFGKWWAAILVPAIAILAVVSYFQWTENAKLDAQLSRMRADVREQRKQLDEAREIVAMMEARGSVSVALKPMPGMPKGAVRVVYNSETGKLYYDGWVEPPPDDKSYQLWLVPMKGKPISAGVFNPVTGDSCAWMTNVPEGVTVKAVAVTMEPAGGELQPTGPEVLVGPTS